MKQTSISKHREKQRRKQALIEALEEQSYDLPPLSKDQLRELRTREDRDVPRMEDIEVPKLSMFL